MKIYSTRCTYDSSGALVFEPTPLLETKYCSIAAAMSDRINHYGWKPIGTAQAEKVDEMGFRDVVTYSEGMQQ